jgi:glutathione peroxidase
MTAAGFAAVVHPTEVPMRIYILATAMLTAFLAAPPATAADADACPTVLNYTFNSLQTGKSESLCQFRGKVLLIVNTASYCGYTHQFEGLEALYRKYKSRGLVILGFPSNDFGGQEPGNNKEIAEFCRLTYGVEFPMFEKSSVTSVKTNPLFAELLARTGQSPQWNFHKYLVDRDGKNVTSFGTRVEPDNRELVTSLEKLLAEKPAIPKS